jgi:hypothetical protein
MVSEDAVGLQIALGKAQQRRASSMEGVMQHLTFDACLEQHRAGNLPTPLVFTQRVNQQVQANPWSNPADGIHQAHVFCRPIRHFPFDDHQVEVRTFVGCAARVGPEQDDAVRAMDEVESTAAQTGTPRTTWLALISAVAGTPSFRPSSSTASLVTTA